MSRLLKVVGGFAVGLALCWLTASLALYAAMRQPPARFGAVMAHVPPFMMRVLPFQPLWMSARAGALSAGDIAPDFELPRLHGEGTVKLSHVAREKPVVMIFGSYT